MPHKIEHTLSKIFEECDSLEYVLARSRGDLSDYTIGCDIDLYCIDPAALLAVISSVIMTPEHPDYRLKISQYEKKSHIDWYSENKFILRFDVVHHPSIYKNVSVSSELFYSSIYQSIHKNISGCSVKVPNIVDDLLIRYIEFLDLYFDRPDKIKHIEYIESIIGQNKEIESAFFDKLERIVKRSVDVNIIKPRRWSRTQEILHYFRVVWQSLKNNGIKYTLLKILKKFIGQI